MKVRFCGGEFVGMDDVPEGTLVDVVIRPEDVIITKPEDGTVVGEVTSVIFKGMHYEVAVESGKYEMIIRTTRCYHVGDTVGMQLEPDGIHVMLAEDHTTSFVTTINGDYTLDFNGKIISCDLTQVIPKTKMSDGVLVDENGENVDVSKFRVVVSIQPDDIEMSDDVTAGLVSGKIINLIYKGDHYSYVIRTEYGHDLIVDDEYLVVEEVVTVTDWGMLGITEIYSATNAVSAVRILNEKKIDIMICDIEMPQTDGLELSKKAKENFPDLEIVMLTSHAEFIYVRTALRYGCYDYLLKPVMEDDIIKVMKNLVTKIERERHQAQLQEEGIVWNQLKPVWKEKYWEEMLRGLRDDPNRECEEYEEKQWKEEQDRRLIPILFYQYANDKAEEDIKQTRKKVKEDLGTVAGDFLLPVLSQKEYAGLVFISDEWLSSGTERNGIILKDAILQQFKTERLYEKIGICIGEVCTGREVQSMVDKLRQFAWNNVCSRRQILDIINMPKNSEAIGMPDMTLWKAYIDNGKTVELQDIIRKWLWGKDNEAKLNRRALQMLQYDLEQLFYSTLQENGIQAHQFLYDRENGCNRVTAIGSLEEMDAWIEETMGAVSRIMQDVSNLSGIREQTIYYIQTHLDEELNRIKVASALYLNPDYLDRRFKKEMGCSVNRYILREQVNMAKGLLLNPKISVCEIASRCGYENMSNFSAMFKREVGISPNEYRKNGGMERPDL